MSNGRKAVPNKLRAILQRDINSKCPFCENEEVGHFEVHHINSDRSDNAYENLIMTCPTCHSKIEKGDIAYEEVIKAKVFSSAQKKIEVYKITIDQKRCSWIPYENVDNAFKLKRNFKSPYPIIQFHFINHSNKTVVLTDIELRVKYLYSGLSGLPNPMEVPKSDVLKLIIETDKDFNRIENFDGIQIPAEQAFILQLELVHRWNEQYFTLDSRQILFFTLKFNDGVLVEAPRILMNTENDNEGIEVRFLD